MKTIEPEDAMVLEEMEQTVLMNQRTRRAIYNTYGRKSATKKRHKLLGKRKWKNKDYTELEGEMTRKEYNARQNAIRILKKIDKERAKEEAKKRNKHSLY